MSVVSEPAFVSVREVSAQLVEASARHDYEREIELLLSLRSCVADVEVVHDGVHVCDRGTEVGVSQLVAYLLDRRYGWSERADVDSPDSRLNRFKQPLNAALDEGVVLASRLSGALWLGALLGTVCSSDKPVVREQTFRVFFDWLKGQTDSCADQRASTLTLHFPLIKRLIIRGLTDVWSVVRKKSSQKLYLPCQHLSFEQVRVL